MSEGEQVAPRVTHKTRARVPRRNEPLLRGHPSTHLEPPLGMRVTTDRDIYRTANLLIKQHKTAPVAIFSAMQTDKRFEARVLLDG